MSTTDDGPDQGWYPEGWVDPIDRDDLPEITAAEHDDHGDPTPPPDRLAEEPEEVEAEDKGQQPADILRALPLDLPEGLRGFVPSALGIDLRNYRQTPQQRGWGAPCTARLARVAIPGGAAVTVDSRLAELVLLIMSANVRDGYAYRAADTGAYNCRKIAGSTSWSWHAWGIAIDQNWQSNPYTAVLTTDMPVWLRHRWNRYGFAWGGDYSGRKDAMHVEWMGTPQDAVRATELARIELAGQAPAPVPSPVPGPVVEQWKPRVDAALGSRVVSLWDVGTDVSFIQRWHGLKDDGYFGPDTDRAVRDTQRRNGLTVDGDVGPATWRVMLPPSIPSHTMPPWPSARMPRGHYFGPASGPVRSHGGVNAWERPYVQAIQRELIEDGCVPGVTDWRNGWADARWEGPTTDAMARKQRRDIPGTTIFGVCYSDDYAHLAR